jgi:hypothetical protein
LLIIDPLDKRKIQIKTFDFITNSEINLGKLGLKIDTEGFVLNVILGATETLKSAECSFESSFSYMF